MNSVYRIGSGIYLGASWTLKSLLLTFFRLVVAVHMALVISLIAQGLIDFGVVSFVFVTVAFSFVFEKIMRTFSLLKLLSTAVIFALVIVGLSIYIERAPNL